MLKWLVIIPVGLLAVLLLMGSIWPADPAREAIALCWKEQQRKSLDQSSAQFVAGACERMEANYIQKHGRKP